jgi:hypothetical protein
MMNVPSSASEAPTLEHRIIDLVNAAFGLTSAELALMWKTASPRMPFQHMGPSEKRAVIRTST